jgi:hypothetical protein
LVSSWHCTILITQKDKKKKQLLKKIIRVLKEGVPARRIGIVKTMKRIMPDILAWLALKGSIVE